MLLLIKDQSVTYAVVNLDLFFGGFWVRLITKVRARTYPQPDQKCQPILYLLLPLFDSWLMGKYIIIL